MMRSLRFLAGGAAVLPLLLVSSGASAQNVSNEAWIGQVGTTNTVDIDQAGRRNSAGGSVLGGVDRQINQDGVDNLLSIEQFGHSNEAGTMVFGTGDDVLSGLNQVGDRNEIAIVQRTGEEAADGSNMVGTVRQSSASPLPGSFTTNRLSVEQTGPGAAGHYVGSVVQIFDPERGTATNIATIAQTGGGLGRGNALDSLRQTGVGNVFGLSQDGQSNAVRIARQSGSLNVGTIGQRSEGNLVEEMLQDGDRNRTIVDMDGLDNTIQRIHQSNASSGAEGNRAEITLVGNGNGGAGIADPSFYSQQANDITAPGNIVQYGDQNDVRITIVGDDNRFGSWQQGEGNSAVIVIGRDALETVKADRNDSAIFQSGEDNVFSHEVVGNDNAAAVWQQGKRNRVIVSQFGDRNLTDIRVVGDDNNAAGVPFTPGSSAALVASLATTLDPGLVFQRSAGGLGNAVLAQVDGNDNNFGFHQDGDLNEISGFIAGSFNQLAVVQVGTGNVSLSNQSGAGNSLGVLQSR